MLISPYGTNNEFGFDYLRDNMSFTEDQLVQRGHHYTIVDEVDSVLIDEARTPLIYFRTGTPGQPVAKVPGAQSPAWLLW